ncbi:MAG: hypothetical protein PUE91_05655, partial [Clostridiales bacterium]|nr:hypothetical protein [Clostridiales bacterium]
SNREGECNFTCVDRPDQWAEIYSEISNYLHGREMQIVLDDDPDYYYTGIVRVDPFESDKTVCKITVTYTLDPFKYEKEETKISVPFNPMNVTFGGVDLSVLGRETGNVWNTDYRFGSSAIPGLDLSAYASITISWEGQKTYYQHNLSRLIQIIDGNENFYEIEEDATALHNTIKVSDIAAAGVDVTNIYRVLIQYVKTATVGANAEACIAVHADGSKFPAVPIIESFYDDVTLSVNGKTFELQKGIYSSDDIIITESGADFLFLSPSFEDPEMPIGTTIATITYRKGWL